MKILRALLLVAFVVSLVPLEAGAGIGRGRSSSGFRGSRGWSSPQRSAPRSQYDPYSAQRDTRSGAAPGQPPLQQPPSRTGGLLGGLGAGLAGGFLGSMLFRSLGGGGMGGAGGGFGGLLLILLLAGIGFLLFRMFQARRMQTASGPNLDTFGGATRSNEREWVPAPQPMHVVEDPTTALRQYETNFDREQFQRDRGDDFFRLQAAFGNGNLEPVRDLIAPELSSTLEGDMAELARLGHRNRMENVAVRSIEATEAWHEEGRLYATVRIEANALDYVVEVATGKVVSGSATEPSKFEEYWTFVRGVGFQARDVKWRLTAIERA